MKKIIVLFTLVFSLLSFSNLNIVDANESGYKWVLKSEKIKNEYSIERVYYNNETGEDVTHVISAPESDRETLKSTNLSILDLKISLSKYYKQNNQEQSLGILLNDIDPFDKFESGFYDSGNGSSDEIDFKTRFESQRDRSLETAEQLIKKDQLSSEIDKLNEEKIKKEKELEEKKRKEEEEKAKENSNNNVKVTKDKVIYVVKSGDTLSKIANKYGISVDELMKINNLSSESLSPGTELTINKKEEKKETEKFEIEDTDEKSFDDILNEKSEILDQLNKDSEVNDSEKEEIQKQLEIEPKKSINYFGLFSIIGILLLAGLLTAGLVYWKKDWFFK